MIWSYFRLVDWYITKSTGGQREVHLWTEAAVHTDPGGSTSTAGECCQGNVLSTQISQTKYPPLKPRQENMTA